MSGKVMFSEELKMGLKAIFGTEVKEEGLAVKTHVNEIVNDQFGTLYTLAKTAGCKVNLKRSGTGITVLLFL
jgi:hypothetical protein